ncbi:hypothetical protein Tco_1546109 [Tanacetum coccineum]
MFDSGFPPCPMWHHPDIYRVVNSGMEDEENLASGFMYSFKTYQAVDSHIEGALSNEAISYGMKCGWGRLYGCDRRVEPYRW